MGSLLILAALAVSQGIEAGQATGPETLRPGDTTRGVVSESDATIDPGALARRWSLEPVRTKSYRLRIERPGPHAIELRSRAFDAYLVLRDPRGAILAEDDNGLVGLDARIVREDLAAGVDYSVEACSLGGAGDFELSLVAAAPEPVQAVEHRARDLEDAEERVRWAEQGGGGTVLAVALHHRGEVLYARGDVAGAERSFAAALEIRAALLGPEHPAAIDSLGRLAAMVQVAGRPAEAEPMLERTIELCKRVLGPGHPRTAESLRELAALLRQTGELARARELLERALAIQEEALGEEDASTAATLHGLGLVLEAQGDYPAARNALERALAIQERTLGAHHEDTAATQCGLAYVVQVLGDLSLSRSMFERALGVFEETLGPDHPHVAVTLNELAGVLEEQGLFEEARPLYERSLAIWEGSAGPDHPNTGVVLTNLGLLLKSQGFYEDARPLYERALGIAEKTYGHGTPQVALVLNNLGCLHDDAGDPDGAVVLLEEALGIQEELFGPHHPAVAETLDNLGHALAGLGRHDEARAHIERALEIWQRLFGPEHSDTLKCQYVLAKAARDRGDLNEARELFERVVEIERRVFETWHPRRASGLVLLALVLADLGETDRAREIAREVLESQETNVMRQLWSLTADQRLYCSFAQDALLDVLLSLTRTDDLGEREYELVLATKGRAARSLSRSKRSLEGRLDAGTAEILRELDELQSEISEEFHSREVVDRDEHARRLAELRERRGRLESALVRRAGPAGEAQDAPTLEALRAALPMEAAALDFLVVDRYEPAPDARQGHGSFAPGTLLVWIVRSGLDRVIHVDLGPAERVTEAVSSYVDAICRVGPPASDSRGVAGPERPDATIDPAAAAVRALLWEPVAAHLEGAELIFVSPDGSIGMLPLEVIPERDGSFLIEHRRFVYLRDLASLAEITAVPPAGSRDSRFLALGAVDYLRRAAPEEGGREERAVEAAQPGPAGEALRSGSGRWPALPGTAQEVSGIAALHASVFGDPGEQVVLMGRAALEERIVAELPRCTSAHVATHGFFESADPRSPPGPSTGSPEEVIESWTESPQVVADMLPGLLSGLVCAGADLPPEPGRDDGLLTAEELSWLDLSSVDLVVLSACETGLGRMQKAEGVLGLRSTLRQAGVRTVVSSLWSVEDRATSQLMQDFYRHLWLEGRPKIDALRMAELEQLERNRRRHGQALPATWGAFVLDGDWR